MMVLPEVYEAACRQVDLISEELQQLHSVIQTQRATKKKHHYSNLKHVHKSPVWFQVTHSLISLTSGW